MATAEPEAAEPSTLSTWPKGGMMRYAFIGVDNLVAQVIVGSLNRTQLAQFERDYAAIFGATKAIEIADDAVPVWIGGTYTLEEGFLPPPPPPAPEVIEGESEEIIEEIVEGTTNDAA
jgi:hypothetical protein